MNTKCDWPVCDLSINMLLLFGLLCSDDLLNYEIGDVDDNDLIGADEDELLLSDDGKLPAFKLQIGVLILIRRFFVCREHPS